MAALAWYKWWFCDWRRSAKVRMLSAESCGVWREMIDVMYENETYFVEGTIEEISLQVSFSKAEVSRSIKQLEKYSIALFEKKDNKKLKIISNKVKVEIENREYERKKKQKQRMSPDCPLDVPLSDSDSDSDSDNKEKERKSFDEIYDAYGKKIGKVSARKAWSRISKKDYAVIFEHIPGFVQATPDKKFRPNLSTYLNQRLFEDEELPQESDGTHQKILTKGQYGNLTTIEKLRKGGYSVDNLGDGRGYTTGDSARIPDVQHRTRRIQGHDDS